jgi:hypothetical protein
MRGNPLDRLDLQRMASGGDSLVLTQRIDWDGFPAYAEALLECLHGTATGRVDGPDQRMWTVSIEGQSFWLTFDEWLHEVSLDPKNSAASAVIPAIRETLLQLRAGSSL